jgi:hypothetical protein
MELAATNRRGPRKMSGFEEATWLVPCAGMTALGLIGAWVLWRRRGAAAGLRFGALALLPLAAWLSGTVGLFWDVGTAVGRWAGRLVLSPRVWAGVALAGLAVVLFLISGLLRRRAPSKPATTAPPRRAVTARPPSAPASADDDFSEAEEILRRRGIG